MGKSDSESKIRVLESRQTTCRASLNDSIEWISPAQAAAQGWAYPSRGISLRRMAGRFGSRAKRGKGARFTLPSCKDEAFNSVLRLLVRSKAQEPALMLSYAYGNISCFHFYFV